MRSLSAAELLTLWEAGQGLSPLERALLLVESAYPELGPDAPARLTMGQRDGRQLSARPQVFGPTLASLSTCPECGESLEHTFSIDDIRSPGGSAIAADVPSDLTVEIDGRSVRFRLPNSKDLSMVAVSGDLAIARAHLAERCILADGPDRTQPGACLSEPAIQAIAEQMALADPQGDIQLALSCPACSREWVETFDISSYFWTELAAWVSRTLDHVHRLATAYGWREADILAMSPWRRQAYLDRVWP